MVLCVVRWTLTYGSISASLISGSCHFEGRYRDTGIGWDTGQVVYGDSSAISSLILFGFREKVPAKDVKRYWNW